jgi:hypothetical protein
VILTQNLQANAIIEHVHQMLGNLIRSFQLQDKSYYDLDDPWGGILVAIVLLCIKIYVPHNSAGGKFQDYVAHFWSFCQNIYDHLRTNKYILKQHTIPNTFE